MKIVKILKSGIRYFGEDKMSVPVQLEDGSIGYVFLGGDCEVYFHKGQIRVHVKRNKA